MATSSFDKSFVVSDPETVKMLQERLSRPSLAKKTNDRDYKAESARGIQLLKRRLSVSQNG